MRAICAFEKMNIRHNTLALPNHVKITNWLINQYIIYGCEHDVEDVA